MRRNVGCSVLRNPSLRGVARPAPIVLAVACVVLTARDALDTITAYYTWTPQSGELFGWDLPPLVVVSQILSYSFVPWLGAPLSLLVRLRRELPPRMQQQLIVCGVPEGGLMCALVRAALLHALLFLGIGSRGGIQGELPVLPEQIDAVQPALVPGGLVGGHAAHHAQQGIPPVHSQV